jgi:sec-independent protein translocase protein TatC
MAVPFATSRQLPPDDQDSDGRERLFSILERLEAVRRALIHSAIAVLVGIVVAYNFIDRIVEFMLAPAVRMLPAGSKLIYTEPTEAFALYFNTALIAGVILASPFIMFQIWRLIAPVLYKEQKRFIVPFVFLTTAGVLSGAAFAHYIMFPAMLAFFGTFSSPELQFMPKIRDTFGLYVKMLMGMTLVFQIPTIVFFLAKMGMVTASFLWKQFRYAILIAFIVAAVLTPSADPWNQTIFAGPMIALYIISIGIAWVVQPRRGKNADEDKEALVNDDAEDDVPVRHPRRDDRDDRNDDYGD